MQLGNAFGKAVSQQKLTAKRWLFFVRGNKFLEADWLRRLCRRIFENKGNSFLNSYVFPSVEFRRFAADAGVFLRGFVLVRKAVTS